MLELVTSYSLSKVPYIHDNALEEYAEKIVLDFSPEIMLSPQPFNAEGFVEYYLGLEVEYRRIRYDRKVLGMTAFNTGYIQVINEETGLTEPYDVTAGTVIVDPILTHKRNQPCMRFTITHEGCHWMMHRQAFAEDNPLWSPLKTGLKFTWLPSKHQEQQLVPYRVLILRYFCHFILKRADLPLKGSGCHFYGFTKFYKSGITH